MGSARRDSPRGTAAGLGGLALARTAGAAQGEAAAPDLRLGVCDWSLGMRGRQAFEAAGRIGLEGVQISPPGPADTLSYATAAEQAGYRAIVRDTGVRVASVGLTVTNACPLATDPRGPAWLVQTVEAAHALGCRAALIACFAKGDLLEEATGQLKARDVDAVVGRLKEAAPHALKKGVVLGLESLLSAADNLRVLDRVGSDAVQVYYDIANSTSRGYDVPAEIRMLRGRISQFHFKNTQGVLGEEGVKCEPIAEAVREIGYRGWLVLERSFGGDPAGYFGRNVAYLRRLFGLPAPRAGGAA
jgi:sugar phosphate isomerase/epimerase